MVGSQGASVPRPTVAKRRDRPGDEREPEGDEHEPRTRRGASRRASAPLLQRMTPGTTSVTTEGQSPTRGGGARRSRIMPAGRLRSPAVAVTLMDGKALAAQRARGGGAARSRRSGGLSGWRPCSSARTRPRRSTSAGSRRPARRWGSSRSTTSSPPRPREDELLALVAELNADERVTGILVQLPLPEHMDEGRVIRAIAPIKDVDGFHPASAGHLLQGEPTFVAATPAGIMEILRAYEIPLEGARAVVVGRSNIVGQADGAPPPRRERDRDHVPQPHARPARRRARGGRRRRGRRARRDGDARDGARPGRR